MQDTTKVYRHRVHHRSKTYPNFELDLYHNFDHTFASELLKEAEVRLGRIYRKFHGGKR